MIDRNRLATDTSVVGALTLLLVAPLEALITLGVVAIVVVVSGYPTVGALVGSLVAPLLVAIGHGVATSAFGVAVAVSVLVVIGHQSQLRRLRAGQMPRLGCLGIRPSPGAAPGIGLWAKPVPHGVLGRSALSLGAVLITALTIVIALLVTGALT